MIGHTTGRQPDIISSCCECLKSLKCSDLCYILLLDCWTSIHRHSTANIRIYWGYWGMSPWVLGMRSKTWTRCTCCLQKRCLHQKAHLLGVPNGHEDLKQGPWFAWFAWLGTSMRQVRWIARNLQGAALWSPLASLWGHWGPLGFLRQSGPIWTNLGLRLAALLVKIQDLKLLRAQSPGCHGHGCHWTCATIDTELKCLTWFVHSNMINTHTNK